MMRRRRASASYASLALAVALSAACKPAPRVSTDVASGGDAGRPARRVVATALDTLWTYGGESVALLNPAFLAADTGAVYVGDPGGASVVALDAHTGRQRWRTTGRVDSAAVRDPRAIGVRRRGGVQVFDRDRRTIVSLTADGRVDARIAVPAIELAQALCELPDGSLLVAPMSMSSGLVHVGTRGEPLGVLAYPWAEIATGPDLLAASLLAPTARGCINALILGRGFAAVDGERFAAPLEYVERAPLPRVTVTRVERGDEIVTSTALAEHVIAAQDIAVTGGSLVVAFGGRTNDRAHLLDVYDSTGTYRESYRTARRVEAIAANESALYILSHRVGAPMVVALRWPPRASGAR